MLLDLLEAAQDLSHLLGRIRDRRESCDVSCSGMHENEIRLEIVQFGIAEDRVFKILVIFGFEKLRLNAVVQKEEFQ